MTDGNRDRRRHGGPREGSGIRGGQRAGPELLTERRREGILRALGSWPSRWESGHEQAETRPIFVRTQLASRGIPLVFVKTESACSAPRLLSGELRLGVQTGCWLPEGPGSLQGVSGGRAAALWCGRCDSRPRLGLADGQSPQAVTERAHGAAPRLPAPSARSTTSLELEASFPMVFSSSWFPGETCHVPKQLCSRQLHVNELTRGVSGRTLLLLL